MTFQGRSQLYYYSKDPVMNSMLVTSQFPFYMLDSQAEQVKGLFSLPQMPFFHD